MDSDDLLTSHSRRTIVTLFAMKAPFGGRSNRSLVAMARLRQALPAMREDPNRFLPFVLAEVGSAFRQAPVHRELQRFLSAHSRALIEMPRDHGKTTQVLGRILWELGRDPSLRIKIVCGTDAIARERVRFLREAIASNERLRLVWPGLVPASPWLAEAFTIERPAGAVGPTVAAFGIGSGSTGTRADLLVCDDVVDAKSIASPAQRELVRREFENNLMNLLEPHGRFWGLCTPWHDDDLNAGLKKNPSFAVYRKAIGPDDEPIWPEHWNRDRLTARRREIGEVAYARAYRLVTVAEGNQLIPMNDIHFIDERPGRDSLGETLLAIDLAATTNERSDQTAMVMLGRAVVGDGSVVVCLDAVAGRWDLPAILDQLRRIDRHWRPDRILIETNGGFRHTGELIAADPQFLGRVDCEPAKAAKADRVRVLGLHVRHGSIRFLRQGQDELIHQMTAFPHAEHDDVVDACATGAIRLIGTRAPRAIRV